jgi:hypothetical protein
MKRWIPRAALAVLLLTVAVGCNVLGAVAYKVAGPEAVPAKYKPVQLPMVVLADVGAGGSANFADADALARYLTADLTKRGIAPMVPAEAIFDRRGADPDFGTRSIAEIGRLVQADQVLYVELNRCSVTMIVGSSTKRGSAAAMVRLVDAASGDTIWPSASASGYPVQFETPMTRVNEQLAPMQVRSSTLLGLSDQITKLFFDWKPGEDSDTLPED